MKFCADTWFFIQLSKGHPKAVEILERIKRGKGRLVIPSVTILELTRLSIRTGKMDKLEMVLHFIRRSIYIDVIDLGLNLAKEAGKLSASYGVPSIDAVVACTCISEKCGKVLTDDGHFDILEKQKILKKYSW